MAVALKRCLDLECAIGPSCQPKTCPNVDPTVPDSSWVASIVPSLYQESRLQDEFNLPVSLAREQNSSSECQSKPMHSTSVSSHRGTIGLEGHHNPGVPDQRRKLLLVDDNNINLKANSNI